MDLTNHTILPAALYRGALEGDVLFASLVVRATYDLVGHQPRLSEEQAWPLSGAPWECEYGPMDGDEVFYKGGVDLFVFGHARAPRSIKTTQGEVMIEVGESFKRRIAVFGDRVWVKQGRRLVPSEPRPFEEIPLTPQFAFGGKDEWDELDIPFAPNPDGRGFFLEQDRAEGQPLPNLEDPDRLIRNWDDQPDPVGTVPCSMQNPLRVKNGMEVDDQGNLQTLKPVLFNAAYPNMIVDRVAPGDPIRVSGVTGDGPFECRVPTPCPSVRLQFDDEVIDRALAIDQVGLEIDKQRIFVTYRYPFRYVLYPLQRRSCELFYDDAVTAPAPVAERV